MDLETQGSDSEFDLISAIGYAEESAEAPEPEKETEPVTEPPAEEAEPDPKEEIARLQRIIATDPTKRAAYEAEKYGVAHPQPTQAPVQQTEQRQLSLEEEFAEKFPGEEYDPFNIRHSAFVQQFNLRPAFSYIEQTQKEEQEYKQKQAQDANRKAVEDLNKGVQDLFIKGLPVVGDLMKAETLDYKQETLMTFMENKFQEELTKKFPARADGSHIRLWASPEVHKEVVREIIPTIKQLAADLGLAQASQTKTVAQQVARETYVESSNAVPSTSGNPFDDAIAKGDVAAALGAFSKTFK